MGPRSMVAAIVMSASLAHLASAFHPHTTFHSPSFHVYIEDTDAYGVMYNANYLRAYERALHTVSFKPPSYVTSFRSDGDDHDAADDASAAGVAPDLIVDAKRGTLRLLVHGSTHAREALALLRGSSGLPAVRAVLASLREMFGSAATLCLLPRLRVEYVALSLFRTYASAS